MAAGHVSENALFTTCTNPIIHLFNPPKICIGIVFDFPEDIFMSQENLQTMITQNFGGLKEVYYGIVQVVNKVISVFHVTSERTGVSLKYA